MYMNNRNSNRTKKLNLKFFQFTLKNKNCNHNFRNNLDYDKWLDKWNKPLSEFEINELENESKKDEENFETFFPDILKITKYQTLNQSVNSLNYCPFFQGA